MTCVTTVRYTIKFNGTLLQSFAPECGLRQGDPLSPFLFLFVTDVLSELLNQGVRSRAIEPMKICRAAPGVSHLLVADDTLLFFKANQQQAEGVKSIINVYENATGQLINPLKCSILFGPACSNEAQEVVRSVLEVKKDEFEPKYLGLPTPDGRMHRGTFQNLQVRLMKRICIWGDSHMAQAGKETLIKAVAQAIPAYIMGDDLTRMVRNYWWGQRKARGKLTGWLGRKLFSQRLWGIGFS